jgi:hypothetical protein
VCECCAVMLLTVMDVVQSGTVGMWTECRVLIVKSKYVGMLCGDVSDCNGRCRDRYGGNVDRVEGVHSKQ